MTLERLSASSNEEHIVEEAEQSANENSAEQQAIVCMSLYYTNGLLGCAYLSDGILYLMEPIAEDCRFDLVRKCTLPIPCY